MTRSQSLILSLFLGLIFGATIVSSKIDRDANRTAAVGAAILEYHSHVFEVYSDPKNRKKDKFESGTLCLESNVQLDWKRLSDAWPPDIFRPAPSIACRSETISGNFGLFSAITNWFDSRGEPAAFLRISKAFCESRTSCVVEIDSYVGGERYFITKEDDNWVVVDSENRWVV